MSNILKMIAVILIIAGFFLRRDGWPEGDTMMKCGIAAFLVIIIMSQIRISKYSRGKHW